MSSGDEFDKLMSSLSEDFGSEIAKDFEGLDKLQARTGRGRDDMVDFDYQIDDVDLALMYEVAQRIHDEWYDSLAMMPVDEEGQEGV